MTITNSYGYHERRRRRGIYKPSTRGVARPLWGLDTRGETSINFKHPLTRGWVDGTRETVVVLKPEKAPEGVVTVTEHEIKVRMP